MVGSKPRIFDAPCGVGFDGMITVSVTFAVWDLEPLIPVTVIV